MRALLDVKSADRMRAGWLRRFADDQRGAVAVWVGLSLTVFIGCGGLAVDTARGYMVKARLSQALDAAALAGAKSLGSGHVKEDIEMFFEANFPAEEFDAVVTGPIMTPADPDAQVSTDNTIKLAATATIDTTLMSVLGFKTMTVAAEATAVRGLQGLDVVIAIDVSGSMCETNACEKIKSAQSAAKIMIDTVYKGDAPKVVTIEGVSYNLLNIGLVPWNSKVNVTYNEAYEDKYEAYNDADDADGFTQAYTDPITGVAKPKIWRANNSEVNLLYDPGPNWQGGVYARYIDTGLDKNDDADMKLGYGTFGGKDWVAYEPITTAEGEPNNGPIYTMTTGGLYPPLPAATITNWTTSNPSRRTRNCYSAYYNDSLVDPKNHPIVVPDTPSWWTKAYPVKESVANPSDFSNAWSNECSPAPKQGILPLFPVKDGIDKDVVDDAVDKLYTGTRLQGGTGAAQGLFWAWEVLMPGEPFDQAKASVPFNRTQAIVLLTDGESTGVNGDAYKGVFGPNLEANKTDDHGSLRTGDMKCDGATPFTVNNNLNGRLYALAKAIKGDDPETGVKIFVVQYQANDASLKDLLQLVATKCDAPYYFLAGDDAALKDAFLQIAATLSVLRLEK
nr:pilus assembly protein TadG-related protein [uncultured Dongia sp.]